MAEFLCRQTMKDESVWYYRCEEYRIALERLADHLNIEGDQRGYSNNAEGLVSDAIFEYGNQSRGIRESCREEISALEKTISRMNGEAALVQIGSERRWELLSDIYEKISAEIYPTND